LAWPDSGSQFERDKGFVPIHTDRSGTPPLSAYYDNSCVDEIKRSGFLAGLCK
jgi:hypothetical protein